MIGFEDQRHAIRLHSRQGTTHRRPLQIGERLGCRAVPFQQADLLIADLQKHLHRRADRLGAIVEQPDLRREAILRLPLKRGNSRAEQRRSQRL